MNNDVFITSYASCGISCKTNFPKTFNISQFQVFHLKKYPTSNCHVLLHKLLIVFFLSLSDNLFYTNKIDTVLYNSKAHI